MFVQEFLNYNFSSLNYNFRIASITQNSRFKNEKKSNDFDGAISKNQV